MLAASATCGAHRRKMEYRHEINRTVVIGIKKRREERLLMVVQKEAFTGGERRG